MQHKNTSTKRCIDRPTSSEIELVRREFDEKYYLQSNPDVRDAGVDPIEHFIQIGWRENRDPNGDFSVAAYLNIHDDVKSSGMNPFLHYQLHGKKERRKLALCNSEDFPAKSDELVRYHISIIEPEFDKEYYKKKYSDVLVAGIEPIEYFVKEGVHLLHNPNANFCTELYLAQHPDLNSDENPFVHFLLQEDTEHHKTRNRRHIREEVEQLFDTSFYLKKNPDVCQSELKPLDHFLMHGWREYRDPNEWFDVSFYIQEHGEKMDERINPLVHFVKSGREQGLITRAPLELETIDTKQEISTDNRIFDVFNLEANKSEQMILDAPLPEAMNVENEESTKISTVKLKNKILNNYCLSDELGATDSEYIVVFDRYDQSAKKLYGYILDQDRKNTISEHIGLVVYPDVVSVCIDSTRRFDVEEHFKLPTAISLDFSFERNERYIQDVQKKLSGIQDNLVDWNTGDVGIYYKHSLNKVYLVNGLSEGDFKIQLEAAHLSSLVLKEMGGKRVSDEVQIKKISENIDIGYYGSQANVEFKGAVDAAIHYIQIGALQLLNPSRWFNTGFYTRSSSFAEIELNPFYHYLTIGRNNGVYAKNIETAPTDPSGVHSLLRDYFNANYYLASNPDILECGLDAYEHYMEHGCTENRNPSPNFDTGYYLEQNPDVSEAKINPFAHYVMKGRFENRRPHPNRINLDVGVTHDPRRDRQILRIPGKSITNYKSSIRITKLRVAVHVHMFYEKEFEQLCGYLKNIPAPFHLQVTTCAEENIDIIHKVLTDFSIELNTLEVAIVENKGRDVWPMLSWLMKDAKLYDLVLHVHTKKSVHLGEYASKWSRHIYDNLIGSTEAVKSIVSYFENNPSCGITYPVESYSHRKYLNWGLNKPIAEKMFANIGLDPTIVHEFELDFPAGNMFWLRPAAIKQLLTGKISSDMFPNEPILTDGTIAHTIERCLPYIAHSNSFTALKMELVKPAYMPLQKPRDYLLSIIVPMFNCADWLHSTIGSLVNQGSMFPNCEILLVDNNSTDDSLKIANHYSSSFSNIKYVLEPKQGAGNARNKGINISQGKYITFLDADDILVDNSLEHMYSLACRSDADMVVSNLKFFDLDGFGSSMPHRPANSIGKSYNINQYYQGANNYKIDEDELAAFESIFNDFGPCAKLYKKEFLRVNKLTFPEGTNYEDNVFIYRAYLTSKRLVVSGLVSYLYRKSKQRTDLAQSMRNDKKAVADSCEVFRTLITMCSEVENTYLKKVLFAALGNRIRYLLENPSFGPKAYKSYLKLLKNDKCFDDAVKVEEI